MIYCYIVIYYVIIIIIIVLYDGYFDGIYRRTIFPIQPSWPSTVCPAVPVNLNRLYVYYNTFSHNNAYIIIIVRLQR